MTNFSGIDYHKKLLKILEINDSYFQWDTKPACEWEARRRIINEFDSRLDAYKDPFAIEEVAMDDMLAMPVIIVLAMNATKLC